MKGGEDRLDDKKITELLIQKDEKGIDELLKKYEPLMKYIISPILKNPQDKEDCICEVTMRVWEKAAYFDVRKGSLTAWLTAITRNTALNFTRSRAEHTSLEDVKETVASNEPTPEEAMMEKERQAQLQKAINALPNKEKTLFYRKYYYLQPISQIASEMGMTERAIEGKLYRLKKKLRKMLGGEKNE